MQLATATIVASGVITRVADGAVLAVELGADALAGVEVVGEHAARPDARLLRPDDMGERVEDDVATHDLARAANAGTGSQVVGHHRWRVEAGDDDLGAVGRRLATTAASPVPGAGGSFNRSTTRPVPGSQTTRRPDGLPTTSR